MSEEMTKRKGGRRPDAEVAAQMGISLEEFRARRKKRLKAKASQTLNPETNPKAAETDTEAVKKTNAKAAKKPTEKTAPQPASKPAVSKIEMYKLCIGFAEEIEKLKAEPEEMFAIVRELLK